jgi:hypothetical protein
MAWQPKLSDGVAAEVKSSFRDTGIGCSIKLIGKTKAGVVSCLPCAGHCKWSRSRPSKSARDDVVIDE